MSQEIQTGFLHTYCAFDVANEIKLEEIKTILKKKPVESQIQLDEPGPTHVRYREPPISVTIGKRTIKAAERELPAVVTAKIFTFGAITIHFKTEFTGSFEEMKQAALAIGKSRGALVQEASAYVKKLVEEIQPAMRKPNPDAPSGFLLVAHVKEIDGKPTGEQFEKKFVKQIASTLTLDDEPLSQENLAKVMANSFSYHEDDFIAASSRSAVLYSEKENALDVLEYALVQFVELRLFDSILDKELEMAYDEVEKSKKAGLFYNYEKARDATAALHLEVSEIVEKIENAIKLVGDGYLVRCYTTAAQAMHLQEWRAGIYEKRESLEHVYEILNDKAQTRKDNFLSVLLVILELIIVILIAVELIKAGI